MATALAFLSKRDVTHGAMIAASDAEMKSEIVIQRISEDVKPQK